VRKGLRDLPSFPIESGERPDGAAKLQHAGLALQPGETAAVAIQSVKPAGNFETERRWQSVLHPRARGERRGAEYRSEFRGGARQSVKIRADEVQSFSQLQNEAGVDGILAGCAPMDESRGVLVALRDERGELLNQRDCKISSRGGSVRELREIDQFGPALFFDSDCGRRGNYANTCLGASQRGFKIKHSLNASAIGEKLV
jgi:hypothetical protein